MKMQTLIDFLRDHADMHVSEVLPIVTSMVSKKERPGDKVVERRPLPRGFVTTEYPEMRLRLWCELTQVERLHAIAHIAPEDVDAFVRLVDGQLSRYYFDLGFDVHVQ